MMFGNDQSRTIVPLSSTAATPQRAASAERVEAVRRAAPDDQHAPESVRAIFDYTLSRLTAEQAQLDRYRSEGEKAVAPYDVKREHKALYAPKNTAWQLVDVPEQRFLAVDGTGDPNTAPAYARAVEALYATAYTLKFVSKKTADGDFVVGPLEGLWWSPDPGVFTSRAKDSWHWTMLISVPHWITGELIEDAKRTALAKKKNPVISEARDLTLREGRSAQVLHIGSYDDEAPLMAELHGGYLAAQGLRPAGTHHEVYLGDPRRTAPEKLRTVLRQPVEPVSP